MTELYVLDRSDAPIPAAAEARLPSWRKQRLAPLKNESARQESLAAGLLYAYAAGRRGLSPDEPVTILPAGKPVFAGRNDMFFSLSHSGRFVLCAFGDAPVGADVQQMRRYRPGIMKRFSPGEQAWLSSLPEEARPAAFFRLWARKEAWVKAASGSRMLSLSETDVIRPLPGWFFFDMIPAGGYTAALCSSDPAPPAVFLLSSDELVSD